MIQVIKCGEFFSGANQQVVKNVGIVVEDNQITKVAPFDQIPTGDAQVIDLSDKFVMPGLIDGHMHMNMPGEANFQNYFLHATAADIALTSVHNLQKDLMAGFTTIRDEGAYQFTDVAVKNAITSGLVVGPRAMVSGECLTATGGHADSHFSPQILGETMLGTVVNSPDEGRAAARYNLKHGADQLKIMATGGVMSMGDDPHASEFTLEEMKAMIDVAKSRGRITSAHAHGKEGIKTAIRAGITTIEHGMLMDEECMELMMEHGVYLIPTIVAANNIVVEGVAAGMPQWMVSKAEMVLSGHKQNLELCRAKGVKIGFGSDAGTAYNFHGKQTYEFELMCSFGFTPMETLVAATKTNATMMQMIDQIGTIEPGKFADVVAFDESPLTNIKTLNAVSFVMKNGQVVKENGRCVVLACGE